MAGLSVIELPRPRDRWRVDVYSPDFETVKFAAAWDGKKAKMLRRRAKKETGKRRIRLLALADLLDPEITPVTPQTQASSRYLREQRIQILGWVWKLVAQDKTGKVARFDIIKPAWGFSLKRLWKQTPQRLRAEFRADLMRAAAKAIPGGGAHCKGFLFAVLHGDFENPGELFQVHWHVVATGDWVAVVDQLREMKAYKTTSRVNTPIRARRKLDNLAYALTYIMKSYWPYKWRGYVSLQKKIRRSRGHGLIPEPFNSALLMWLHRYELSDMVLMINMRAKRTGLSTKTVHK